MFTPEVVDIAEYDLLRFRLNSNSREFRSFTGGVIHSSSGAQRDEVEFHFGSFASVGPDHGDFRSTPVNGHSQDRWACLKGANGRLMHRSKQASSFDHVVTGRK